MNVIITWLESLVQSIFMIIKMGLWLMQGLLNFGTLLLGSVNILAEVMDILPAVVASSIMSACAILVILRIIGR